MRNCWLLDSELGDKARYLDVEAAVFGDLAVFFFAPPADGVEAVGGLSGPEAGGGDVLKLEAVPESFFDVEEEIEAFHLLLYIPHAVALEDAIVEFDVVEADDEIGTGKGGDKAVHFGLGEDFVFAGAGAVDDADGHAHLVFVVPAADVAGAALGFEVEIDEILRHGWRGLSGRAGRRKVQC